LPAAAGKEDVKPCRNIDNSAARPLIALYVGGMGARGRNFYHDIVARYGYEAEADKIQELYPRARVAIEIEKLAPPCPGVPALGSRHAIAR